MDCLFCKIVRGDIPAHRVYEDDRVVAFLDIYPKTKGHTLVIPKAHAETIRDIRDEDIMHVSLIAKRIAMAMPSVLHNAGVNLLHSSEKAAQQEIPHFHMHVIPRYLDNQAFSFATKEEPGDLAALAAVLRISE